MTLTRFSAHALVLVLGFAPLMLAVPASAATTPTQVLAVSASSMSAAPEAVEGFTAHCRQRMLERGVAEPDVRMTVLLYRSSARFQPGPQTWLYVNSGSGLQVVLNDAGECVTVF